jgi:hypothetical protein
MRGVNKYEKLAGNGNFPKDSSEQAKIGNDYICFLSSYALFVIEPSWQTCQA